MGGLEDIGIRNRLGNERDRLGRVGFRDRSKRYHNNTGRRFMKYYIRAMENNAMFRNHGGEDQLLRYISLRHD